MVVPEDCCTTMNAEWHTAYLNYALQNVTVVTDADTLVESWSSRTSSQLERKLQKALATAAR